MKIECLSSSGGEADVTVTYRPVALRCCHPIQQEMNKQNISYITHGKCDLYVVVRSLWSSSNMPNQDLVTNKAS